MRLRNHWLSWALAATLGVFAYGGAALAQVPTPAATPGLHNPPGWKPHVAYPFNHHLTPEQEMRLREGKRMEERSLRQVGGEAEPFRRMAPTAAYTPSPEMLQQMRKAEENSRKHGYFTVSPPHVDKHWGTANGRPPERYHRTAPPPSFPPGGVPPPSRPSAGTSSGPQSLANPSDPPIYTQYQGASWTPNMPGGPYPMDLSAAVDGTYMVQLTNAGMYVLDKTTGAVADTVGLYSFWCTDKGVGGSYLAGCGTLGVPTDVQIAHTSVYPGGRWVATTLWVDTATSPLTTPYIWLGISKTNDPRGAWYLWSFQTCQDFSGSGSYPNADQPTLGVSPNMPGGPGRIIVDMRCVDSSLTQEGPTTFTTSI